MDNLARTGTGAWPPTTGHCRFGLDTGRPGPGQIQVLACPDRSATAVGNAEANRPLDGVEAAVVVLVQPRPQPRIGSPGDYQPRRPYRGTSPVLAAGKSTASAWDARGDRSRGRRAAEPGCRRWHRLGIPRCWPARLVTAEIRPGQQIDQDEE